MVHYGLRHVCSAEGRGTFYLKIVSEGCEVEGVGSTTDGIFALSPLGSLTCNRALSDLAPDLPEKFRGFVCKPMIVEGFRRLT
ncbi:hypothetical protein QVD17_24258 [Tagetes erecta]|uniref:Uncharacterized protein n=1 Tax=Tagetes erecta TaxID=13708 RepID=A0AAD8KJZ8_TARER|nr:hypothetical protein QVD17_24258 [Tagetes erecta]